MYGDEKIATVVNGEVEVTKKVEKKSVVVIGAGPAGLTAAVGLLKRGYDVSVIEAESEVGGMSKSFELWGHTVDLGPHRYFSSDTRVNKIWLESVTGAYHMVSRLTRIYYQGKYYNYPLDLKNVLGNLGIVRSLEVCISYIFRSTSVGKADNFENWTISRFGRQLYLMFFKTYSERLWGMSCTELDADFARQRIRKLSLFEVVKAAILGNSGQHKTLADVFAYPKAGSGAVYQNMAKSITELGGRIYLSQRVDKFESSDGRINSVLTTEGRLACDYLISTMPITSLVRGLNPDSNVRNSVAQLEFRNTVLVYLLVNQKNVFSDQWVYIHDPEVKSGRITNFSNWGINDDLETSVLCLEYWCNDNESLWSLDNESLASIAKSDIHVAFGLSSGLVIASTVRKVYKSYPVYRCGYANHMEIIKDYLDTYENVFPIGRYGAFKYNNQDHSILMGILVCEKISGNSEIDLWSVNSDDEYQESSRITQDGLVVDEG